MADTGCLHLFREKMAGEGLDPLVIQAFAHYYRQVAAGATGRIPEGEQAALYEHLVRIRREAPKWLDFAERKDAGPGKGDSQ